MFTCVDVVPRIVGAVVTQFIALHLPHIIYALSKPTTRTKLALLLAGRFIFSLLTAVLYALISTTSAPTLRCAKIGRI